MTSALLLDGVFLICGFTFTFFLGLPFVVLMPSEHFRFKYLASPLFGYAFAGFIATILYRLGISQASTYGLLWGLNLITFAWILLRRKDWVPLWRNQPKNVKQALFIWIAATLIIVIPYWVGGPKFYAYQGWIHDQFSYLGSSLTYAHETFKEVRQSSGEFFLRSPVSIYGAIDLYRRPTMDHVFGLLSLVHRQEMYRWCYLFLAFLASNGILAGTFLIVNVFNCSLRRALVIAAAIYLGFWGQTYIDFDAWGMAGAIPVMLLLTGYIIVLINHFGQSPGVQLREFVVLACLYGFSIYIYPEDAIFHLPAFIALIIFACLTTSFRHLEKPVILKSAGFSFSAFFFGFVLTLPYLQGTLGYFFWTAKFTASNAMTQAVWATYLEPIFGQAQWFRSVIYEALSYSTAKVGVENNAYILRYLLERVFHHGDLALAFAFAIDGFYGVLGMYFLTPLATWPIYVQQVWRLVLMTVLIAIFINLWKSFRLATPAIRTLFQITGILAAMLFIMLLGTRIYGAGRGLYLIAPYLLIVFFTPILITRDIWKIRYLPFFLILVSQISFGLARIGFAATHVPHYQKPYSMAETYYFPNGKKEFDWNLGRFDSQITKCHSIYIDVPNGWQEYFVTFYLYSRGKKFVKKIPVKTSYWDPTGIGKMKLDGSEDCVMSAQHTSTADGLDYNELKLLAFKPSPQMIGDKK